MFAGVFTYAEAPPPNAWSEAETWCQELSPFIAPDVCGHWHEDNALLVETQRFNTPWSHLERQVPERQDHLATAIWGRLDNRAELAQQLNIDAAQFETMPDAHLVLIAWRRWGEALSERLLGDFALVVIDSNERRLFLARDPLGVKPLYYWPHAQGLVFATTVSAFRCLERLKPTPDDEWIARYLLKCSMSHERTGYKEIFKLPAGHYLSVDGGGRLQLHRWHQWRDDAPSAYRRQPRWMEAYREVLEEAIRCRMASTYPLGTENSGGIDSATVTAYLARLLGNPGDRLHSFGFARCEQEPQFILETSRETGIIHNYLIPAAPLLDTEGMHRALRVLGYPEEHSNATCYMPFYRECMIRGIRTLFSGFGGDEVVTNSGGHIRYELLDQKRYGTLWGILPGNPATRLLRLGKTIALGYRRPDYNLKLLRAWNARWPHQPLRPEVVTRLGLYEIYMEGARHDAPYRRINDWIINGLLRMPYISTRLENCTLVAASFGIDYCWPLWDMRLVQQYLSTPAIEKVGPKGIGRFLHRRAITGVVPHRVAWKPTKDMGDRCGHQANLESRIKRNAEIARSEEARLHPRLEEMLDRPKWRDQIEQAAQGRISAGFFVGFSRTTWAVQWLNQWLHGKSE